MMTLYTAILTILYTAILTVLYTAIHTIHAILCFYTPH